MKLINVAALLILLVHLFLFAYAWLLSMHVIF